MGTGISKIVSVVSVGLIGEFVGKKEARGCLVGYCQQSAIFDDGGVEALQAGFQSCTLEMLKMLDYLFKRSCRCSFFGLPGPRLVDQAGSQRVS